MDLLLLDFIGRSLLLVPEVARTIMKNITNIFLYSGAKQSIRTNSLHQKVNAKVVSLSIVLQSIFLQNPTCFQFVYLWMYY